MNIFILSCGVFEPELNKILKEIKEEKIFEQDIEVKYLPFGLHTNLNKLKYEITANLDKLKSYNFWITLVSAIILLLQVFGEKFNFKIDSNFIIDVTTALCSIFVVLGIISVPKSKTTKTDIRFVEPNYQELSEQISKELSQRIDLVFSAIKQQEPNSNEENVSDFKNVENSEIGIETTNNNCEQKSETNSESEMISENECQTEGTENANTSLNVSISNLNDDIKI